MRDSQVVGMINAGLQQLAQQMSGTLVRMAREIDELRAHITAETIRRQAFEEFTITDPAIKEKFEALYQQRIEDYNTKIKEAMAEADAAAKAANPDAAEKPSIALPPKKTLYGADGTPVSAPVEESVGG